MPKGSKKPKENKQAGSSKPPKEKEPKLRSLNNSEKGDMEKYIANARTSLIHVNEWTTNWIHCHGESRTTAALTWHLGAMRCSDGTYKTVIRMKEGRGHVSVEGTLRSWGTERPNIKKVLNSYKREFDIEPTSSSESEGEDEN
ncbi:hypothetical protein B0T19DRAFT_438528 [Cercophora scortea]|uniref:Uncharacterized protein n=1 Tax=Cercophora scortea TaxID=314031 RepID=A0AAE0MGR9_9PEZI|nr:hypothetical protein B0T19DRAFT_438528 [Cercophora scortea]